ncbi:hypothetical protein [Spiroplasma monobiae]|uniref:Transmembrane protein n=1 Tax=Spiroplasma monobiae MQ-1 TaxID=1336748 RepID=A0A2K9LY95_SPISQ|nr:hypothetical protein [Spiroplasma monobiae]AUM62704.1 hypothetical protein SMONO_v1c04550 [Spiroplasma monobiae MQ-1]
MDNKIQKIKQSVFKIAVCSMVLFLISLVLSGVFVSLLMIDRLEDKISFLWLGLAVLTLIITIFTLFSLAGGFTFLNSNKEWKEIPKVRKKSALDWGLFYFIISNKIEKLSDLTEKEAIKK